MELLLALVLGLAARAYAAKMKAISTNAVGVRNHGVSALCVIQPGTLEAKCWDDCRPRDIYCGSEYPPPAGVAFRGIAGGWYFNCGLTVADHRAVCWGSDYVVVEDQYKNVSYSLVTTGGMHACALRMEPAGKVDCWGRNYAGEGSPPNQTMISLAAGNNFTCGLTQANKAVCWGRTDIQGTPEDVEFEEIYAGREHVCATVRDTKETRCWGVSPDDPKCIPPKGHNFSMVTAGTSHSCGLREENQEVLCWGNIDTSSIVGIPFSTIASGGLFACGIRLDQVNQVLCWGDEVRSPPSNFRGNLQICTDECQAGEYQVHDQKVGARQCYSSGFVCLDCPSCSSFFIGNPASNKSKLPVIIGGVGGGVLIVVATVIILTWVIKRSKYKAHRGWGSVVNRVRRFSLQELQAACNNFAEDMVLGEGGFAKVYKGVLREPDGSTTYVAIKKPHREAAQPSLTTELLCLSRLYHKYLVNLVGYCDEPKLLVFEFMAHGSLSDLYFKTRVEFSWVSRIKMASQAARGLEYLHALTKPPVIHRDVKLENILLDDSWDAHISDFGLSKQVPITAIAATHLTNVSVVGTPAYLDPQYWSTKQLTAKSDVYSFGMVLLVMLTGKKPMELGTELSGIFTELCKVQLDPCMALPDDPQALLKTMELAKHCLQPERNDRPNMTEVVVRLDSILLQLSASNQGDSQNIYSQSISQRDSQTGDSQRSALMPR